MLLLIQIVYAEPVLITVVDPLNNLVDGASLQIYCEQERKTGETDQFGTYYVDLPAGECRAYARFKDAVGVTPFSTNITELTITLDKTIITLPQKTPVWPFFLGGVVLIAVIAYFLRGKKTHKTETKKAEIKESKIDAVLDVLGEREKQIVQHLIKNNGQSTQAKIRYDTGLPKASLSRNIKNLEAKNIISVQSIGNMKRITLKK